MTTELVNELPSEKWDKRMEVVSRFLLLGNMRLVSEQTGVGYGTLMEWKKADWWPEMVEQLRRQKRTKTNDSLTKIIEQSLEVTLDRLENGDFVHDQKTGQVIRKPVNARDASAIADAMLKRQEIIEAVMDGVNNNTDTQEEILTKLALEFKRWATKTTTKDVVDIEAKEVS